jgi:anti-sigma B factor antagonist
MTINTEQVEGVLILHLQEEALDASNAKEFKSKVATFIAPGTQLIFDLSSLKFVDSSGLGALLSCLRQLNSSGGALKLCAMVKPVRALFELVRMHRVFEIFNTREEAIRSFNGSITGAVTFGD